MALPPGDALAVGSLPAGLDTLTRRWEAAGRPAQSAIAWPRAAWVSSFPEQVALLGRLPDVVDRAVVVERAAGAADSEVAAVEAFVAAMVWGYGNVGYGRWRTRRVLESNRHAAAVLRCAAEVQATAGAVEAYRYLANEGRLRFLGPAFGTKFLHFVPQHADGPPALILDAIVSRAIRSFAGIKLSPTTWRTSTFEQYLALVGGWSDELGIAPADTEMLLFVSHAPRQWREPWVDEPAD